MATKLIGLPQAAALIPDGATLSLGGLTAQRHPVASVYQLIRLGRKDLSSSATPQQAAGIS